MKRLMLIIGVIISLFAMHANAEQTRQQVSVMRNNPDYPSNSIIGSKPHRSQTMLPTVELVYDTDNNSIDIMCSYDCDAEVTVFDAVGNIVAISDIKDTIFIPYTSNSFYIVTIEAAYWYGTAEIRR
ncbi:hypothetical protein [uncultured Muribaculum sp.]|uniref:hypothetical protein n=1 Tax=uncultured Muribaculum sp. TaxID=1918613 RepID=UPI00272E018F|nr:hypothetical protein [uncultured Muribaculum sp.]